MSRGALHQGAPASNLHSSASTMTGSDQNQASSNDVSEHESGDPRLNLEERVSLLSQHHEPLLFGIELRQIPRDTRVPKQVPAEHSGGFFHEQRLYDASGMRKTHPQRDQRHVPPSWLSSYFLIAFLSTLLGLAAGSILLWRLALRQSGFAHNNAHYAWTFGPTALLTVIVGLWTPVSYSCRMLQPWRNLEKGRSSAQQSVLLDHVSPLDIITFVKAAKYRHTLAFSGVSVSLLLRLSIIVSTGLLIPSTRQMPFENVQLESRTQFTRPSTGMLDSVDWKTIESAYLNVKAFLVDGLPYPDGIQSDFAYQNFGFKGQNTFPVNGTIRAAVDVFRPQTQCQPASLTLTPLYDILSNSTGSNPEANLTISVGASSSSCPTSEKRSIQLWDVEDLIFAGENMSVPYLMLDSNWINCSDSNGKFPAALMTIYEFQRTDHISPDAFLLESINEDPKYLEVSAMSSIICTFGYAIQPAQIALDLATSSPRFESIDWSESGQSRQIPDFSDIDYANAFPFRSTGTPIKLVEGGTGQGSVGDLTSLLTVMLTLGNTTYSGLVKDPSSFANLATYAFGSVGVQMASDLMIAASPAPLGGQIMAISSRLQVSGLATWVMIGSFLAAAMFTWVVNISLPRTSLPWRIDTMLGAALTVSKSPSLSRVLHGLGHLPFTSLVSKLRHEHFWLRSALGSDSFAVEADANHARPPHGPPLDADEVSQHRRTWRPFALRPYGVAIFSLYCSLLVVSLFLLLHLSQRPDGLAQVANPGRSAVVVLTRIMPTLLVSLAIWLCASIRFNILLLSPLSVLKESAQSTRPDLDETLLGQPLPLALVLAARRRYWAALLILSTMLFANLLPIFVSGLFEFEQTSMSSTIPLQRLDSWDPAWSSDGEVDYLILEFATLNLTYPPFTTADLAIPSLNLHQNFIAEIQNSTSPEITVTVEAARGDLHCTLVHTPVQSCDGKYSAEFGYAPGCFYNLSDGPGLQFNCPSYFNIIAFPLPEDTNVTIGTDIPMGERVSPKILDTAHPECPTWSFTFGHYTNSMGTISNVNLTTAVCFQLVAQVTTEVTLRMPDMVVLSAVPDESTVKYFFPNGSTTNIDQVALESIAIPWVLPYDKLYGLVKDIQPPCWPTSLTNDTAITDQLMWLLLCQSHGQPVLDPTDFAALDPESVDRVMAAMQSFYRRYMAQVLNRKNRRELPTSQALNGTWQDSNHYIVRQDRTTTVVIATILGIMLGASILAYIMMSSWDMLYHSPCSIAGMYTLFAGSVMCQPQNGDDRMEDSAFAAAMEERWADRRFAIGWWKSEGGCRFGIDIRDDGSARYCRADQGSVEGYVNDKQAARVDVAERDI